MIWVAIVFDALFLGFCSVMVLSKRARLAYADWLNRNVDE